MKAMKALFSTILVTFIVGSSMGLTYTGAQAQTLSQAVSEAPSEALIQAPQVPLSQTITEVTTIPAPLPTPTLTEAPTEAPTATLTEAPAPAPTETPTEPAPLPTVDTYPAPPVEPTTAGPVCMEDQPCWDCTTMGNKICGNPVCIAQGLVTAADQTCIDYWEPSTGVRMVYFQGDTFEAQRLYFGIGGINSASMEQQLVFADTYRGVYKAGYAPADAVVVPSSNPANVYAFYPYTGTYTDPYSGNAIVPCGLQGLVTAEDFTCAPTTYWDQK